MSVSDNGPLRSTQDGHQDRLLAARGLAAIIQHGRTLDQFERSTPLTPLAAELLYGACRHYFSLAAQLSSLLRQPIRQKDQEAWALLIVGAYQLRYTRVPDHAAIAATVAAAKKLRQPWAAGLINGTLRTLLRTPTAAVADTDLPLPLSRQIEQTYGALAPALMTALNQRAPMALRINTTRVRVDDYRVLLNAAGLSHRQGLAPETLLLDGPVPAATLPGYADGAVAIQDAGAQLCCTALRQMLAWQLPPYAPLRPVRVLDACAAPGGKLFHFLEQALLRQHAVAVTALESSAPRLAYLREEAHRLGHDQRPELRMLAADATHLDWWDGIPFDLILLDAPCSGSGTLRRHPDIKLLRDFDQLTEDIATQDALLQSLTGLLADQGRLLYATCSILPAENDARIERMLRRNPQTLGTLDLDLPSGSATAHGWQLLPTDPDTDGFYYAALVNLK